MMCPSGKALSATHSKAVPLSSSIIYDLTIPKSTPNKRRKRLPHSFHHG